MTLTVLSCFTHTILPSASGLEVDKLNRKQFVVQLCKIVMDKLVVDTGNNPIRSLKLSESYSFSSYCGVRAITSLLLLLLPQHIILMVATGFINNLCGWNKQVGAHLLLFFLAFVFGSFCTFCFHMLMFLFDEKCVLFPKLLSLTSLRHNVIYELLPPSNDYSDLPVDFVSTQWVEKSTCVLPTYVPLISGIFGLVWTTMFLMCSTGTRTLTGLQRPWRVLPPVFVFSTAMSILCIYSSTVTHYGLQELCIKLGEITGSSTCSYTVNVVTLAYERRIRGVYQATRLTIASAWLHTGCWICSTLLALMRVVLAVDFQLVRVSVNLKADIDRLMERHETQLRSISPEVTRTTEESQKEADELNILLNRSGSGLSRDSEDIYSLGTSVDEKQKYTLSEDQRLLEAEQQDLGATIQEAEKVIKHLVDDIIENVNEPTTSKKLAELDATIVEPRDKRYRHSSLKSKIKNAGTQTDDKEKKHDKKGKTKEKRVIISDLPMSDGSRESDDDKKTQAPNKEKQD